MSPAPIVCAALYEAGLNLTRKAHEAALTEQQLDLFALPADTERTTVS